MDFYSVYTATCIAAAFGCLVMGLYANLPIALAPGMGLNAYFAVAVVVGMGIEWQVALGAVFCSGVIFLIISVLPIREWLINSIPKSQKLSIAAGIGLFLVFITLQNTGIIVDKPGVLVGLGDVVQWPVLFVVAGFVVIVGLINRNIPGLIVLTILVLSMIGWISGLHPAPTEFDASKAFQSETMFALDIFGAFEVGILVIIFAFLLVDMFDTSGTLIAVLRQAKLLDEDGNVKTLRKALIADSSATVVGSMMGTSTITSYIESVAGVSAGGRTGLTAVTVGVLILIMIPLAPIAGAIPEFAVAPAILYIGCLMMSQSYEKEVWDDFSEGIPAVITLFAIPISYSIATGIGMGFISYVLIKLASGKWRELHPAMAVISLLFALKFFLDS